MKIIPTFLRDASAESGAGWTRTTMADLMGSQTDEEQGGSEEQQQQQQSGAGGEEQQKPADEQQQQQQQAAAPAAETPKDWRETVTEEELLGHIKTKFDRKVLMSAAGLEQDEISALEFKKATGDWTEYLRIKTTDFNAMPPEKLIEIELKEKYSDLGQDDFELILKTELRKYNLDRDEYPENSDEAKLGQIILNRDGAAIRNKLIEKQNGLKAPEKKPDDSAQDNTAFLGTITTAVRNSEVVKQIAQKKSVSFGAGEEAFNYEIKDLDTLVSTAITSLSTQGKVPAEKDIADTVTALAVLSDLNGFYNSVIAHGKTVAERALRREAVNPGTPGGESHDHSQKLEGADGLAKNGVIKSLGEIL